LFACPPERIESLLPPIHDLTVLRKEIAMALTGAQKEGWAPLTTSETLREKVPTHWTPQIGLT